LIPRYYRARDIDAACAKRYDFAALWRRTRAIPRNRASVSGSALISNQFAANNKGDAGDYARLPLCTPRGAVTGEIAERVAVIRS